jgi:hypothetical protein
VTDLKEARERLHQTPSNSSRPPSSQAPWVTDENEDEESPPEAPSDEPAPQAESGEKAQGSVSEPGGQQARPPARKPGKQKGAPGYGRTPCLAVTETVHHRAPCCECCEREAQAHSPQTPWTAYYNLDIEVGEGEALGIRKHLFYALTCPCGHPTRQSPYRAEDDGLWEGIGLSEWRLVGPTLGALILALSYRARMSRARTQELPRAIGWALSSVSAPCSAALKRPPGRRPRWRRMLRPRCWKVSCCVPMRRRTRRTASPCGCGCSSAPSRCCSTSGAGPRR